MLAGLFVGEARPRRDRAEAPAKFDLLIAAEGLIAQQDEAVAMPRGENLREARIIERLGEIDALDLGAERVGERPDADVRRLCTQNCVHRSLSAQNKALTYPLRVERSIS
jgi:hypothetical protein